MTLGGYWYFEIELDSLFAVEINVLGFRKEGN